MKKLLFPGTGFPGGIKTLQALQDNTMNVVQGFARTHENYTVLYGMEVNSGGTIISAGAFVYNGEIIPFKESPTGTKITIFELIEQASFNTDPNTQTSLELLNAYSTKSAETAASGGIHTFDFAQLKRYTNQIVLAKGVTVGNDLDPDVNGVFHGVVHCAHRLLTNDEINNSMVIYTVTWANNITSHTGGCTHSLLRRSNDHFLISLEMNLSLNEKPQINWQIVKM